ncbi:dihydrodipicolinate synthase family protein [Nonomuraea sp. NBC_00507]|uniref:dihydrodipicolinate synthase family protein n=1 Tax=Nonomuraea sp. NBC_00507 TaxID=2976002 RepID=UPI002E17980B
MNGLNYPSGGRGMSLLTAVFTPFDEAGRLALETVEKQVDALAAVGSPAAFVAGTAGEGASLTVAERQALTERWCEAADGRLDVIVHVGHTSLAEARALAAHAQSVGARAIAAVAPYFHRPADAGALAEFCAQIAEAAPKLPFTYYHIPGVTGVNVRASDLMIAAKDRIPTFAGVKYAHTDLVDLQHCLEIADGRYEVFVGVGKLVLAAHGIGAKTAIGSVYNFAAPLYQRMLDLAANGEVAAARRCQALAQSVIDTAAGYGGELPGFKALTALTGVDCGPCRPPLTSPDDAGRARLRAELTELGFLEPDEAGAAREAVHP